MESSYPRFTVLQTAVATPVIQQLIEMENYDLIFYDENMPQEQREKIQGILCYGLRISFYDDKIFDLFPNVKVITTPAIGVDHVDVEAASRRGIQIGYAPDRVCYETPADLGFGLLLASARNIVDGNVFSRHPEKIKLNGLRWDWFGVSVTGSTLGIVGMGNIGSEIAKRGKGFNMRILYHNRKRKPQDEELGAEYCSKLDDLLKQSDFVMITAPTTPETIGMFSSHQFSMMKPTSTLINISRGKLVNTEDLVQALKNGTIRAAALDVTDPEPLPRDHPLLKLNNVIITPHMGSNTLESRKAAIKMCLKNLRAGLAGQKIPYGVN